MRFRRFAARGRSGFSRDRLRPSLPLVPVLSANFSLSIYLSPFTFANLRHQCPELWIVERVFITVAGSQSAFHRATVNRQQMHKLEALKHSGDRRITPDPGETPNAPIRQRKGICGAVAQFAQNGQNSFFRGSEVRPQTDCNFQPLCTSIRKRCTHGYGSVRWAQFWAQPRNSQDASPVGNRRSD
jgi:hypothetical protein